jgi:hypothetical protein
MGSTLHDVVIWRTCAMHVRAAASSFTQPPAAAAFAR